MRISIGLFERFECNDCGDNFLVKQREGEKYCPYCGSTDTEIDGTFQGSLTEVSDE